MNDCGRDLDSDAATGEMGAAPPLFQPSENSKEICAKPMRNSHRIVVRGVVLELMATR